MSLDAAEALQLPSLDGRDRAEAVALVVARLRLADAEGATPGLLHATAALLDAQRALLLEAVHAPSLEKIGAEGAAPLAGFLAGFRPEAHGPSGRAVAEALLAHWLSDNPAARPLAPLHATPRVDLAALDTVEARVDAEALTVAGQSLLDLLRAPQLQSPDDIMGQLRCALERFGAWLPEALRSQLLRALDVLQEEGALRDGGPGPAPVLTFEGGQGGHRGAAEAEHEAFTPDRDWMPNVVLIAKQTHVWLHQLSERFGRPIRRLDEIPDEILDELVGWGFTGLWLIGLWQRSGASRGIKQRTGNPEALASAYAVHEYVVADDLGGEEAASRLRERAGARGLRVAADMVPNHVGMDARWVMEHPDWFVQLPHPPYPGYRFDGPDLAHHDAPATVQIEDGYWSRTDAAVVFRRTDRGSGETRFIYHGNDGTHMPWNDTAQLDFLKAEVREAVAGEVLAVASRFPIIRLDAAMTLARRHIRRLWHPPPGEGGAIPSRAEHGASPADFDALMPKEFWREVVDRVNAERPDTLLLAEAFWMMEGYFVRTLGMHRVYNSAFMNMLKNEDNAKYRETVRNVLAYSPEILLRFVNFMSNPDEETAVELFGRGGDKYFGVCTLMVTMPGLPMFAHGQIEGFEEKYGMEYARAYRNEHADGALVARHAREVFPLMRRRALFSQVDDFAFFDVEATEGGVTEDVFAYSNRHGDERALVLYNNRWERSAGWVRRSVPIMRGDTLVRPSFGEALGIRRDRIYGFREDRSERWYLRDGAALLDEGLFVLLDGYATQVLLDWRELDEAWRPLLASLEGGGVTDLDAARAALEPSEEPVEVAAPVDEPGPAGEAGGEADADAEATLPEAPS